MLALGVTALVAAGLIATRIQWMLPVGATVGAGIFGMAFLEPFVLMRLTAPETVWTFIATVLILGLSLLTAAAGLTATVQNRRVRNPT